MKRHKLNGDIHPGLKGRDNKGGNQHINDIHDTLMNFLLLDVFIIDLACVVHAHIIFCVVYVSTWTCFRHKSC